MVTVSTARPQAGPIAPIDMSKLTQSELHNLSLSSSHRNSEHLFVPAIDRNVFNESDGSRRQTYSRHDLSPSAAAHHPRNRLNGLVPASEAQAADEDPVLRENMSILKTLTHYINQNPNSDLFSHSLDLKLPSLSGPVVIERERKRKRGKAPIHGEIEKLDILELKNKRGIEIDVDALSGLVDPYSEELRNRTEGLETEEELLGFFQNLGGEWASRRKKRKIVDAGIFGDLLPVGWKLLLSLRRREGHVSVYCRRYISPTGQQFISCTEVSSYLRSYPRRKDASKLVPQSRDGTQQNVSAAEKDDSQSPGIIGSSSGTNHSSLLALVKAVDKSGVDHQTHDRFECRKCNVNFTEQDAYLEHLLSLHQRPTRKYRLGSSVGDGVIMKDGKFECQFCHKVFEERRRYNGHVGIHVRDYVRRNEESAAQGSGHSKPESSSRNSFPSKISKMDALLEIAQSSLLETFTTEENGGLSGVSAHEKPTHDSSDSLPDATGEDGNSPRKLNDLYMESLSTANKEDELKLGVARMKEIQVGKTPDEEFVVNNSTADVDFELDNSNNSDAKFVVRSGMVDQNGFAEKNVSDGKLDSETNDGAAPMMDDQNADASSSRESVAPACQIDEIAKSDFVVETMSEIFAVPLRANTASSVPPEKLNIDSKPSESKGGSFEGVPFHDDAVQTFQQSSEQNPYGSSILDSDSKEEVSFSTVDKRDITLQAFTELRYGRLEPTEINFASADAAAQAPLSVQEEESTINLAVNNMSFSNL